MDTNVIILRLLDATKQQLDLLRAEERAAQDAIVQADRMVAFEESELNQLTRNTDCLGIAQHMVAINVQREAIEHAQEDAAIARGRVTEIRRNMLLTDLRRDRLVKMLSGVKTQPGDGAGDLDVR